MKFLFLYIGLFFSGYFIAQSDVFETDGKGNREIERSIRIVGNPKIIDSIKPSVVPPRNLLSLSPTTKIHFDTIDPAVIETEQLLDKLYPFYVKAGMGSALMPLGEFYFNSTRSRSSLYGIHLKHLSFFGGIKDKDKIQLAPAGFDKTDASMHYTSFQNHFMLRTDLRYQNHGFHYYGLKSSTANADSIKQRFQTVDTKVSLHSQRGDTSVLNFKTDVAYRFMGTANPFYDSLSSWKVKENAFKIQALAHYRKNNELFYGAIGLRHNGYAYGIMDSILQPSDSGLLHKNTIIDIQPGIKTTLLDKKLVVDVGFGVSIDVAQKTKGYFYPNIYLQYSFLNDLFIPYARIGGGVQQNSFYKLSEENQFIRTNIILNNEIHPYDISLGFKGVISKKMGYGMMANFARINQKAFFITDTVLSSGNKFNVVYDSLNYTKIEGYLTYQQNEKLKIVALGRFHSYEMMHEARAWNLPQIEFVLTGSYNLYNKFIASIGFDMAMNRWAKVYSSGPNVSQENNQYFTNLGILADANIGLEYRYNTRLSAFLNVNNIASQRYQKWYNYPVMPIQVFAGITARF